MAQSKADSGKGIKPLSSAASRQEAAVGSGIELPTIVRRGDGTWDVEGPATLPFGNSEPVSGFLPGLVAALNVLEKWLSSSEVSPAAGLYGRYWIARGADDIERTFRQIVKRLSGKIHN